MMITNAHTTLMVCIGESILIELPFCAICQPQRVFVCQHCASLSNDDDDDDDDDNIDVQK